MDRRGDPWGLNQGRGHARRLARPPCSFVREPILTSALERHRRVLKKRRSGVHRSAADPPPPALINI